MWPVLFLVVDLGEQSPYSQWLLHHLWQRDSSSWPFQHPPQLWGSCSDPVGSNRIPGFCPPDRAHSSHRRYLQQFLTLVLLRFAAPSTGWPSAACLWMWSVCVELFPSPTLEPIHEFVFIWSKTLPSKRTQGISTGAPCQHPWPVGWLGQAVIEMCLVMGRCLWQDSALSKLLGQVFHL